VRNEDADVDKTSDRIFNFMIFLIIIFGLREKSLTVMKIANTVKRLVVKKLCDFNGSDAFVCSLRNYKEIILIFTNSLYMTNK
jgi:hypothetical protein